MTKMPQTSARTIFSENNFIKVLEQVKRVLHVRPLVVQTTAQSPNDSSLAKLLGVVNLPEVEIPVFSGDPQFHLFMKFWALCWYQLYRW